MQHATIAEDHGAIEQMPGLRRTPGRGAHDGMLAFAAEALFEPWQKVHPHHSGDVFHVCIPRQQGLQRCPEILGHEDNVSSGVPGGLDAMHHLLSKVVHGFSRISHIEGPGLHFDIGFGCVAGVFAGVSVGHRVSLTRPAP